MESNELLTVGTDVSFRKSLEVAEQVAVSALEPGIARFDTALSYETKALFGSMLCGQLRSLGLSREDIYIQTQIDTWQMQDGDIVQHVNDTPA